MRTIICLIVLFISSNVFAQFPFYDVLYLRYIDTGSGLDFAPPNEDIQLALSDPINNSFTMTITGVDNTLEGTVVFF